MLHKPQGGGGNKNTLPRPDIKYCTFADFLLVFDYPSVSAYGIKQNTKPNTNINTDTKRL